MNSNPDNGPVPSPGASARPWKELNQSDVNHFYPIIVQRANQNAERAYSAQWELAKFLFTANTGAAAGLFLLSKSSPDRRYLFAFFLFCAGTFCVGVAYYIFAGWTHKVAEGWAQDFKSREISVDEADKRDAERHKSGEFKIVRRCLTASFLFLFVGGIVAACVFWLQPTRP